MRSARQSGRFADLAPRVVSALVLLAVGLGALWLGGWTLRALLALLAAGIVWEMMRLLPGGGERWLPVVAGLVVLAVAPLGVWGAVLLLWLPAAVAVWGRLVLREGADGLSQTVAAYVALVLLGVHGFGLLRDGLGLGWMLWLIGVVVASDVAGYFVGRVVGGPRFWPRISPKKTWSGTVAGWMAAAGIGAVLAGPLGAGPGLVALSVVVAVAGQGGDIAESALKRRAGIKDSSALIPGHGGLADRFDAMLAAALIAWLAALLGVAG
ncbi:MAG: phosphatidate cytidylyltransferase [Alkalilacustris sp.]